MRSHNDLYGEALGLDNMARTYEYMANVSKACETLETVSCCDMTHSCACSTRIQQVVPIRNPIPDLFHAWLYCTLVFNGALHVVISPTKGVGMTVPHSLLLGMNVAMVMNIINPHHINTLSAYMFNEIRYV